ncbi:MAG: hypothetical protein ACAH83_09325 [Alphaproteobacteria bacterium]
MKGEVFTRFGVVDGKFSVAVFVTELDNQREAVDLVPLIQSAVTHVVREKIRHGLHAVPKDES